MERQKIPYVDYSQSFTGNISQATSLNWECFLPRQNYNFTLTVLFLYSLFLTSEELSCKSSRVISPPHHHTSKPIPKRTCTREISVNVRFASSFGRAFYSNFFPLGKCLNIWADFSQYLSTPRVSDLTMTQENRNICKLVNKAITLHFYGRVNSQNWHQRDVYGNYKGEFLKYFMLSILGIEGWSEIVQRALYKNKIKEKKTLLFWSNYICHYLQPISSSFFEFSCFWNRHLSSD